MKQIWLWLITFYCHASLAQIPGVSPVSPWQFDGYVKFMASAYVFDNASNSGEYLIHNRLNFAYTTTDAGSFNLSLRNRLIANNAAANPNYAELLSYDPGYFDLSKNWVEHQQFIVNSQIDRAYWTLQKQQQQLRLGRQRINWAMATVFNPNDLFNAYSIYDFDYEEGPGSDSLVYSLHRNYATEFNIALSQEQEDNSQSALLRYRSNNYASDWQILGGINRDRMVIGSGFASDIAASNIRGEWSYFSKPNNELDTSPASHVATLESESLLRPESALMLRLSLLYISQPQAINPLAYLTQRTDARNLSFSRWTAFANLGFDINALNRVELSSSYYSDQSYYLGLSNQSSLAENWELLMIAQWFDGMQASSTFSNNSGGQFSARLKWSF
ncbi:hypothetical protein DBZ36_19725 [Alginatibacterium sediminis]|uniref:Porin n=1 Tax=Alginatibacterium sediminis TaxID=2164068 RepID=A0A420E611_9ALTE|nr:hypothetical protein [Alginatibacterium sediminis]RKF13289.1 hypothetical protein DBZ36_19725 [Alginatibacterium sediminis]